MQALAVAYGASIEHAPEPIHGRLSQIQHTHHKLFKSIPSGKQCSAALHYFHAITCVGLACMPLSPLRPCHQQLAHAAVASLSSISSMTSSSHCISFCWLCRRRVWFLSCEVPFLSSGRSLASGLPSAHSLDLRQPPSLALWQPSGELLSRITLFGPGPRKSLSSTSSRHDYSCSS